MFAHELKQAFTDKSKIIGYIASWNDKKIRRLTFFDSSNYGSGINCYLMSKKSFSCAAEALCAGWCAQYLWEEDMEEDFDYSFSAASTLYEDFFSKEVERYKFKPCSETDIKKHIVQNIKSIIDKTHGAQAACEEPESVGFLESSGCYVDKEYTTQNAYILKSSEQFIGGCVLCSEKGLEGKFFKQLFFETDKKYVLILE